MNDANNVTLIGIVSQVDERSDAIRFLVETQDLAETRVRAQQTLVVFRGAQCEEVKKQIQNGLKVYIYGRLTSSQIELKDGKKWKLSYVHGMEFQIL